MHDKGNLKLLIIPQMYQIKIVYGQKLYYFDGALYQL